MYLKFSAGSIRRFSQRAGVLFLTLTAVSLAWAARCPAQDERGIAVDSTASVVHLGSIDSFDITEGGKSAARLLLEAIKDGNQKAAAEASRMYGEMIPRENFGGEYTALQWFCDYLAAPEDERKNMLSDPMSAEFFAFLGGNNYELLREFLCRKYRLEQFGDENTFHGVRREAFLQDYVLFNNPRREVWEKSSKFVDALQLQEGNTVVDVGCGPGYYSMLFAKKVGDTGKVYAIDMNEVHVTYLADLVKRLGLKNVTVARSSLESIGSLKSAADVVWACSLYHIMYVLASQSEFETFIESIKQTLKPSGRLVIVDNALVKDKDLPYHGPYIAKELIIEQLAYCGFKLVATHQFIPQRYMLVFEMQEDVKSAMLSARPH